MESTVNQPGDVEIITNESRLIEVCKVSGVLLSVRTNYLPAKRIAYQGVYEHIGEAQCYRLAKAVTKERNCLLEHHCTDDLGAMLSDIVISMELLERINESLASGKESELLRVTSVTLERTFVYFDVSDFSKHPPAHQALIIYDLVHNAKRVPEMAFTEAQLCIGDGYIFVFEKPITAVMFAASVARAIQSANVEKRTPVDIHFRVGVHTGPVFSFWDPGRKDWNYVGDGINVGQRIIAAIGKDADDVVFLSDEVVQKFRRTDSSSTEDLIVKNLESKGRREDKHGIFRRVYQLNHERLFIEVKERSAIDDRFAHRG